MMELGELANLERLVPESLRRSAWMRPRYPYVAIELREDSVVVTRVVRRKGVYHLAGQGRKELPEGAFVPSISHGGVGDAEALGNAITEALRLAGAEGASRVSVAVPDTVARVFLLDFQDMPRKSEQGQELVRWRLKKSVPFDLTGARIAWQELGRGEDGRVQLLVTVVPGEGLGEIERLFDDLGLRVGLIDLATLGAFNAVRLEGLLDDGEGIEDVALLLATRSYFSLLILRGGRLIFYRAKNYHVHGGFQGEESLRVVGRELRTSLSYYEEHLLGEGLARMHLGAVGVDAEAIAEICRGAGVGDVLPIAVGRTVEEIKGLPVAEACELLPTLGLALRREP